MAIAQTLKSYLDSHGVHFEMVEHVHTESAIDSAKSAHVPAHQLAKAVVLKDEDGYIVSVLPSSNRLNLGWVNEELQRDFRLATEAELKSLFKDCATGAMLSIPIHVLLGRSASIVGRGLSLTHIPILSSISCIRHITRRKLCRNGRAKPWHRWRRCWSAKSLWPIN